MAIDVHEAPRNQIGIRTALVATCGVALFAACSRFLAETGVHVVLITIVMVPGAIGTFLGLAATKTGRRSPLLGSVLGCVICLVPSLMYLLLMAIAGLAQGSVDLTTLSNLGLFSLLVCVCLSGFVGLLFSLTKRSNVV